MFYLAKTPKWVKKLFPDSIWEMPGTPNTLYLTFDDGPHPKITGFVLDELLKYNARATFFCIGKNVLENPRIYNRILEEKHAIGNHTHNHLDGWKTPKTEYLHNIEEAAKHIDSDLFRPPYGRITTKQHQELRKRNSPFRIVMWTVLSGDFDVNITPEQCCENVIKNAESGSVIVFHDSDKAYERLKHTLPLVLKYFSEKGYQFEKIVSR